MNIVTIKACPAILYSAKGNRPVWLCYLYHGYTLRMVLHCYPIQFPVNFQKDVLVNSKCLLLNYFIYK